MNFFSGFALGWLIGSLPSLLYLTLHREYLRGQIEGWILKRAVKKFPPSKKVEWADLIPGYEETKK